MNAANTANAYKTQQIMTASPEELTLMLYNGAIKFVAESIFHLQKNDYEKSHQANLRAQDIIREFMTTLDMKYELSQNYMALYDYVEYSLIQGNIKKDLTLLEEAKSILTELRDAWYGAMKQVRAARAAGK